MQKEQTAIKDVWIITPRRYSDARGYFSEAFRVEWFAPLLGEKNFIQDNRSVSRKAGTGRGLHAQRPPFGQAKLISVLSGAIWDVAVDARVGSPSYGAHVAMELSAENGRQLFVPEGCLHGFFTLGEATEVFYKVNAPYSPEHEETVDFYSPALKLPVPFTRAEALLSAKDAAALDFSCYSSPS